jgi:hypothetical protein
MPLYLVQAPVSAQTDETLFSKLVLNLSQSYVIFSLAMPRMTPSLSGCQEQSFGEIYTAPQDEAFIAHMNCTIAEITQPRARATGYNRLKDSWLLSPDLSTELHL